MTAVEGGPDVDPQRPESAGEGPPPFAPGGLGGALLREVVHELNARASALAGIAQLWRAGSEVAEPDYLEDEVERIVALADQVGLLIPPRAAESPTLMDPRQLAAEVALLLGMLAEGEGTPGPVVIPEGDPPPIRGEGWALRLEAVRALAPTVVNAARAGHRCRIRILEAGDGVVLELEDESGVEASAGGGRRVRFFLGG